MLSVAVPHIQQFCSLYLLFIRQCWHAGHPKHAAILQSALFSSHNSHVIRGCGLLPPCLILSGVSSEGLIVPDCVFFLVLLDSILFSFRCILVFPVWSPAWQEWLYCALSALTSVFFMVNLPQWLQEGCHLWVTLGQDMMNACACIHCTLVYSSLRSGRVQEASLYPALQVENYRQCRWLLIPQSWTHSAISLVSGLRSANIAVCCFSRSSCIIMNYAIAFS